MVVLDAGVDFNKKLLDHNDYMTKAFNDTGNTPRAFKIITILVLPSQFFNADNKTLGRKSVKRK